MCGLPNVSDLPLDTYPTKVIDEINLLLRAILVLTALT